MIRSFEMYRRDLTACYKGSGLKLPIYKGSRKLFSGELLPDKHFEGKKVEKGEAVYDCPKEGWSQMKSRDEEIKEWTIETAPAYLWMKMENDAPT